MNKDFKIETERLILRQFTDGDFDALYQILSDKETMKYYPSVYDHQGVKRWLEWNFNLYEDYGFGLFAVVLKETGEFIGDCGLTMQKINGWIRPEIGYHLNKKYWQQGYSKEAGLAVRDYIFANTTFNKLYSYLNKENIPSAKTAQSIGMEYQYEYIDDGEVTAVYVITKERWATLKEK